MTKAMKSVWTLMLGVVLGAGGCKEASRAGCSPALREVFKDFEYAGSIRDLSELKSLSVEHPISVPDQFSAGTKYVFTTVRGKSEAIIVKLLFRIR
jgi:hypothetical protein